VFNLADYAGHAFFFDDSFKEIACPPKLAKPVGLDKRRMGASKKG